jgi:hypothetical protein
MMRWTVPLVSVLVFAATGCKREEIQVYQAPKEAPAGAPAAAAGAAASPHGGAPAGGRVPWTVPDGWGTKASSSSMRIASYEVKADDGRSLDISVIPLGGQSGSLLENVNRWRNELKLAPVTEADLDAQVKPVLIGSTTGKLLNIVSEQATLEGKFRERTLAALLNLEGTTIFFKLRGEDRLAGENEPKFLAWLKSVQTDPSASAPASASAVAAPAAPSPIPPMVSSGTAGVPPPPATDVPKWDPPAHWKAGGQRPMRLATFEVPGGGGQVADLSISALGGSAGGLLANFNRWRTQQLGLSAATEADLPKICSQVPITGGTATVVDFSGEGEFQGTRMLAAIVSQADRTWFFKLTGSDAVVGPERENFLKFLKSVEF